MGRFEVVALLGAGGMGEVYRARDTRLGRDVALKVLPAAVASEPDRVRRFEHEARAAAALNHPNILALHDVDEHEGVSYLVTELLEGESLRERIARGPLPVKEAVQVAVQVARGLAAAHGKGIVHRDLKPENLFVTADGTVKILDFGLASLRSDASDEGPSTESPTETELTRAGSILGTAGYMAPEQVRGLKVDQRADLFAFGCVLYEMLSGRRAFAGATTADTLGAILKDEPARVEALASDVNPALAQLVARCLEKRPEDRLSSAHDLALALAAAVSDVDPRLARAVTAAQSRPRRTLLLAFTAVAAAATVAVALWLLRERLAGNPAAALDPARVMVAPFENTTGNAFLDAVAAKTADAVTQGLAALGEVTVVPAPRSAPSGDDADLRTAARRAGAGVLAWGSIYTVGDELELRGRIIDPASGTPIYVLEPERGPRAQPEKAIDRVRQRAMSALLMHLGKAVGVGGVTRPPLYGAYGEFLAGLKVAMIDWPVAVSHYETAAELDPRFWQPQVMLMFVYKWIAPDSAKFDAMQRRLRANQGSMSPATLLMKEEYEARADLRYLLGLRKAQALLSLAPRDFVYMWDAAILADRLNRPRDALASIGNIHRFDQAYLRPWIQGAWLINLAAQAHHLLGEHEAELEAVRFGLRMYPDSLRLRTGQVRALAGLGREEDVARVIDEALQVAGTENDAGSIMLTAALELRAHGHPVAARSIATRASEWYTSHAGEGISPYARLDSLVLAGRAHEAATLARAMYEAHPDDVLAVGAWGVLAARTGNREAAEAIDRQLTGDGPAPATRSRLRVYIAAHLGEKALAVDLLREWLARGGNYFDLHTDVDLEPLHGYPPFEELMKPKG